MKKKALAILLTAAMIMGISGCGQGNSTDVLSSQDTGAAGQVSDTLTETSDILTETSDTLEDEAVTCTLTVWAPSEDQDPAYSSWLSTMCEQFRALHPNWNITFNYGVCSESDAKTIIPQDIDAAADVFLFSSTGIENLYQADCLTEFGGSYLAAIQADYPSVLVDCLTYDGGVYGVPLTTNTFFMYYDTSVFTEDDVTSLETMLEKGKVALPLIDGFYLSSFYLGAGCTFFGQDGKDRAAGIRLDGDNAAAMTNYLVDLVKNDSVVVATPADAISMMREGAVDAYFCGTWQAAQTEEILGDNFGIAPLPSVLLDGTSTQLRPFSSAKAVGVKSTTEYPEVAIALAMYLGGYEGQKAHYEARNIVPCHIDLLADDIIQQDPIIVVDSYSVENIAVPRSNFTEMSYFWAPAESFGIELRDGKITHENAAEKTLLFHEIVNSSGV